MRLILFRHGIAEDRRADLDDAARRLTPRGIERTRLASRGLVLLLGGIDTVLTSPKLRALETADLLCQALDMSAQVDRTLAEGSVDQVIALLQARYAEHPNQSLVLVGHEPMLSMLAEELCGEGLGSCVVLKKAGALVLQVDAFEGDALIEAALPPMLLRRAGASG